jgi:hypothetical protein
MALLADRPGLMINHMLILRLLTRERGHACMRTHCKEAAKNAM